MIGCRMDIVFGMMMGAPVLSVRVGMKGNMMLVMRVAPSELCG
jgi:hypothetical protein